VRFFWLEHNGTRYTLREGETLLGRGPECTLFVDDTSVSRAHALFRRVGSNVTVTDLGSSNGTYVNGTRVLSQTVLHTGDEIRVGPCNFVVDMHDNPYAIEKLFRGEVDPKAITSRVPPQELAKNLHVRDE
jgi:pSer/pThr/pTyr-binding forkhead associated (FHA) protein